MRRSWLAETSMAKAAYAVQAVVPDVATTTAGAYAESAFELGSRWRLEAGARFDRSRSEADPERANTNLDFAYTNTRSTEASDAFPSAKIRAV